MSEKTFNKITTEIDGHNLLVRQNNHCLFNLHNPLAGSYQLSLERDANQYTIWMRQSCNGAARLFSTDDATIAGDIMNNTADALQLMSIKSTEISTRFRKRLWILPAIIGAFLVGSWAAWFSGPSSSVPAVVPEPISVKTAEPVAEVRQSLSSIPAAPISIDVAPHTATANPMQPRAVLSPVEAAEARQLLATRLKNGAAKREFTISLSSGHPRSLYVFADPECPNCRIFEPTVQALSAQYNVEIFPVTLIGKARTAEQVVPLLCAPAEKRAEMWRQVFDLDAGMLNPTTKSNTKTPLCEKGQNALARNDMAFEIYRLPGTPTVISDDGRMIPLQAMTSDASLKAFLNSTP